MAVAFRDYYELLGVKKAASYKEVRSAFRKLARQHHPDVNPGNAEAERRFKEVNEANEVLSDPEKRKLYDELGSKWKDYVHFKENGGEATPAEFLRGTRAQPVGGHGKTGYRTTSDNDLNDMFGDQSPFSDFFQQAFSGGRRSSPEKGQNIEQIAQITLREAINGTSRTLTYSDPGGPRRIEAKIPPGVRQGSRIRLAGQGAQGQSGGPPGDLFLIVDIAPDTQFELRDNDVLTTLKVPLFTMLLGGEVTAPTPKGGKAALRIPEGTQNGRVFRLSGLGLPPTKANGKAGALLVRVDAILPSALTPEQKGLVEKLSTMHGQIRDASV